MSAEGSSRTSVWLLTAVLSGFACKSDAGPASVPPTGHEPALVASERDEPAPRDVDADGFDDASDACPDEPGIEPDGCPIRDDDGDGVLNTEDRCPTECERVNGFEDQDGCPDVHPGERAEVQEILGPLEGVAWEAGKWTLRRSSYEALDHVVAVLTRNPEVRLYIDGHLDSKGSQRYESRRRLDRRRADSVRAYLVAQGIAADRLAVRGFGEEQPIASNRTAEGRAQNRRVELVLRDPSPPTQSAARQGTGACADTKVAAAN